MRHPKTEYVIVLRLPRGPVYLREPGDDWTANVGEARRFEFLTVATMYALSAGLSGRGFQVEAVYGR